MKEIWKDVPGYEGYYQVSSIGGIKSLDRTVYRNNRKQKQRGINLKPGLRSGYPFVLLYKGGKRLQICVHKLMQLAFFNNQSMWIDHINGIRSDNRLENLRLCNNQLNQANSIKQRNNNKYKGISWNKDRKKWRASIHYNGKCIHLGRYKSDVEAAKSYDKKAKELFGGYARINFPEEVCV